MVEDNRNWTLLAAHLSFLSLSSLSMSPEPLCQTFSVLIHFLYLTFFSWTAIYGYLFYEDLVTIVSTMNNVYFHEDRATYISSKIFKNKMTTYVAMEGW